MTGTLYLDYNCFQRSFDDQRQARIRMEAAACEGIFEMAARGTIRLVWSFMHEDENALCPFVDRRIEAHELSALCRVRVGPRESIRQSAVELMKSRRLTAKDALHVACAHYAEADRFVTCDDDLRKRTGRMLGKMVIVNPTDCVVGNR